MNEIIEKITKNQLPENEYILGTADLRQVSDQLTLKFNYAVVIARKLDYNIINRISGHPTKEYYNHYKHVNKELESLTTRIATDLTNHGINSLALKPTLSTEELDTVYSGTLKAPFSHKMAATLAGLGWIGKSGLLITKEFGPRLRLVTVLTEYPILPQGKAITKSLCSSCKLCVDACPAKAITGKSWNVSVERESLLDPFKCREMCKKMGKTHISPDARVCGICVSVCPRGKIK